MYEKKRIQMYARKTSIQTLIQMYERKRIQTRIQMYDKKQAYKHACKWITKNKHTNV